MHLAEDVRQAIATHPIGLSDNGECITVTISIRVRGIPDEDQNAVERMIDLSDQALYEARGKRAVIV